MTAQILKENREKLGLSISEVAESTKISSRVLDAIERGDLDDLPALTFLRGFIRTYARHLKLDPEQVMQAFNEEMGEVSPRAMTQPEEAKVSEEEKLIIRKSLTSRTFAALGILILIAIIIFVKHLVVKYEK